MKSAKLQQIFNLCGIHNYNCSGDDRQTDRCTDKRTDKFTFKIGYIKL